VKLGFVGEGGGWTDLISGAWTCCLGKLDSPLLGLLTSGSLGASSFWFSKIDLCLLTRQGWAKEQGDTVIFVVVCNDGTSRYNFC